MQRRVRLERLLIVVGVLLAVAGNILGNVVTDFLPARLTNYALPLFALVTLAAVAVGIAVANLQGVQVTRWDPRRRSRARERVTLTLIVIDTVLAAVAGVLSGAAATSLPGPLDPTAWSYCSERYSLRSVLTFFDIAWRVLRGYRHRIATAFFPIYRRATARSGKTRCPARRYFSWFLHWKRPTASTRSTTRACYRPEPASARSTMLRMVISWSWEKQV
jgi:hypothetical protein